MAADTNGPDEGLYTYDSFSSGAKKETHNSFLWWCAGAQQQLLKKFPSEHSKYTGLGGVLLATFILAALSSGYAIHSIFENWLWTISFAVIWGLIIFNFDRFLVATMRKYGVSPRRQSWMAVPRLALALLIGLTIARPLELKIFEKEINIKMTENLHKKVQKNDSLLLRENTSLLASAEADRSRYANRKLALEDTLQRLQTGYIQEADGTGGSGHRGIENLTRLKMEAWKLARSQALPELGELSAGIRQQDSIIAHARKAMELKRNEYETSAIANMGFLERNKALSDLSGEESSVWWTSFLISLLIILIEVAPVLSKLIMPLGPYDVALAKEELLQMASDENEIRKGREELHDKKKVFYEKQKDMSDELVDVNSRESIVRSRESKVL